jgi:hypothetical protein
MLWQAEVVQAVIFSQPGVAQPEALALWTDLFGPEGPDSFQRMAQNPAAATTAAGIKEGASVAISSQVGRVDIIIQGADRALSALPGSAATPEPVYVDDFSKAAERVSRYAGKLSEKFKTIRLAVVLSLVTTSEGESAMIIAEHAGVPFPKGSTDAMYQFNVRSKMKCAPDVSINRLVNWTAGQMQLLIFSPNEVPQTFQRRDVVTWKIDVNTVPNDPVEQRLVPKMFSELAHVAVAVASLGKKAFE